MQVKKRNSEEPNALLVLKAESRIGSELIGSQSMVPKSTYLVEELESNRLVLFGFRPIPSISGKVLPLI